MLLNELTQIRKFLIPHWVAWGNSSEKIVTEKGEGMCRFTAAFLARVLGKGWKFDGGYPDVFDPRSLQWVYCVDGGGYKLPSGTWEAHYWATDGKVIVDLTASQFGEQDVVIVPISDARYKSTMTAFLRKESMKDVRYRANQWADLWDASKQLIDV